MNAIEEQTEETTTPADAAAESALPPDPPATPAKGPWVQVRVPHRFEWNRYELPIAALPPELEGFRIVHVSDLHLKKFWSPVFDQIIERVRSAGADLVLVTGDFVDNKRNHLPALPTTRKFVSGLTARLGCFGILGNHDKHTLEPRLEGTGVTILHGKRHVIDADGAEIELIGLPGVDRKELTDAVLNQFPPPRREVPRIVLAHFPDGLRKARVLRPDVYLAGHTHGGQICLPGGYPILRHDSLPRRLCRGVNRAADTWLVVNRGLGFTNLPIRLFCPAEIIELKLTRG